MIYMLMKIVFLKKRRVDLNNKSNHSKPEGSLLTKEILKQEEKRAEENSIGELVSIAIIIFVVLFLITMMIQT